MHAIVVDPLLLDEPLDELLDVVVDGAPPPLLPQAKESKGSVKRVRPAARARSAMNPRLSSRGRLVDSGLRRIVALDVDPLSVDP